MWYWGRFPGPSMLEEGSGQLMSCSPVFRKYSCKSVESYMMQHVKYFCCNWMLDNFFNYCTCVCVYVCVRVRYLSGLFCFGHWKIFSCLSSTPLGCKWRWKYVRCVYVWRCHIGCIGVRLGNIEASRHSTHNWKSIWLKVRRGNERAENKWKKEDRQREEEEEGNRWAEDNSGEGMKSREGMKKIIF